MKLVLEALTVEMLIQLIITLLIQTFLKMLCLLILYMMIQIFVQNLQKKQTPQLFQIKYLT